MEIKKIIILLAFLITAQKSLAQKKGTQVHAQRLSYIAKGLNITEERAIKIIAALDYNNDQLQKAIRDTVMRPADKSQLIRSLLLNKRIKIDGLLTEKEQVLYKTLFHEQILKSRQFMEKSKQRSALKPGIAKEESKVQN